jgi:hypothetical protein
MVVRLGVLYEEPSVGICMMIQWPEILAIARRSMTVEDRLMWQYDSKTVYSSSSKGYNKSAYQIPPRVKGFLCLFYPNKIMTTYNLRVFILL